MPDGAPRRRPTLAEEVHAMQERLAGRPIKRPTLELERHFEACARIAAARLATTPLGYDDGWSTEDDDELRAIHDERWARW